jgi:hypothetical protein
MMKTAGRQYLIEFLSAMAAYVVILIIALTIINNSPSTAWWRVPLALAPVIPAIFAIIAYIRAIRRMDELQRRIQFEGIAFSFGVVGILTFSYGFLENVGFPHLSYLWVFPFMIATWSIGLAITARRYS